MKTVGIITTTRADFGLLLPVINELRTYETDEFKVELVVSGTHLSEAFGNTISEIIKLNIRIDDEVYIPVKSKDAIDISHNQSVTIEAFTKMFLMKKYDGVLLLGDRYEMLAIAIAAGNTHIPIFHMCGGDTTEGAMDEWIRHSITKMSYLHFPTNEVSYKRVLQLGESPDRIFNYGSTSIDNIIKKAVISKENALESLGMDNCSYALCTYHPVTLECQNTERLVSDFLGAIKAYPNLQFIVTKSNSDQGGAEINRLLDAANEKIENMQVFSSLGVIRYLSLMKYAEFVMGNSSSGIIETPAFGIPTINIGDRQRGRLQSESIINCKEDKESICYAIDKAMSFEFKNTCKKVVSPYGDGHAAERIAKKILEIVCEKDIDLKKAFYDVNICV